MCKDNYFFELGQDNERSYGLREKKGQKRG